MGIGPFDERLAEGNAAREKVVELAAVDFVRDGDLEGVAGFLLNGEDDSVGVTFGGRCGEGDVGAHGDGMDLAAADTVRDVFGEEFPETLGVAGQTRDVEGLAGDLTFTVHGKREGGELAIAAEDETSIGHRCVEKLGSVAVVAVVLRVANGRRGGMAMRGGRHWEAALARR